MVLSFVCALSVIRDCATTLIGSRANNCQSVIRHVGVLVGAVPRYCHFWSKVFGSTQSRRVLVGVRIWRTGLSITILLFLCRILRRKVHTLKHPSVRNSGKQKHPSSSNTPENYRNKLEYEAHASLRPAVVDGVIFAPSSVRLKASSDAAVGLFMCGSLSH